MSVHISKSEGVIMLKVEELEKQLNQGNCQGIYLLYGEDTFLLEQQLNKIKKNFGEIVKGINYFLQQTNNNKMKNSQNLPKNFKIIK